jgi:hypothetical protein
MDFVPPDVHVPPGEKGVTDHFRVYRGVSAVDHINLYGADTERLYSVYRRGYDDEFQATVDSLRTGEMVLATLVGDPEAPEEAWRLAKVGRDDRLSVAMAFVDGLDPDDLPGPIRENPDVRERAATEPAGVTLERDDRPVGEIWCQPRDPLPHEMFLLNVLTGLVPLESHLGGLPEIDVIPAEVLVLDTATPVADSYDTAFGVFVFLTAAGRSYGDELRERYGLPLDRAADTRPDFDPYRVSTPE